MVAATHATGRKEVVLAYRPLGAARDLFHSHATEVILSGPAGTGKSRACLEKLHLCALKYPGMRGLILRQTLSSLTATGLVTYRERVVHPLDGVTFFGGSAQEPAQFRYPNGSRLVMGGLDNTAKIMSGEYDMIYVQEATDIVEQACEDLTTRLRNGVMPYQQLLADCNPGAPTHWLKRRSERGQMLMLESRHEDNPRLWYGGQWTEEGRVYLARLDALTGVRYLRLRKGIWAAAEGIVYEAFDRTVHTLAPFALPVEWRRFRVVDFGFTNPFVCQWWAADSDDRLYLYREIYHTQRIVADHAEQIASLSRGENIEATIADHDAEDRATLHANGINTVAALKDVKRGIESVQERLRVQRDGKPRLFILQDTLVERDEQLTQAYKPVCTLDEVEGYAWAKGQDGKPLKEEPVKLNDHGMDALRYMGAYLDLDGPAGVWLL